MPTSTPLLFVLAIIAVALIAGCNGDGSARPAPAIPTASDPAFGFIGNVLVADEGDPATATRMWVGFSAPSFPFQTIIANRQRLLAGDSLLMGGAIVPSSRHPLGFHFDPATTRTAAILDEDELTTLTALEQDPEHPKVAPTDLFRGSWVEVRVERIVETPPACGDGFIQLAEDCDPPQTPCRRAFEINTLPRNCNADCTCPSPCGNGVVDGGGEQCDDGNAIGDDGCSECLVDPVDVGRDLATGLQRFVFFRTQGLGFCYEPGSLRRVLIERDAATGEFHLEAAIFGANELCDPFSNDDCPPTIVLPDRTLTEAERAELLAAFAAVRVTVTDGPQCGFDDRCLFHRFAWTNLDADGNAVVLSLDENDCAPRLLPGERQRLLGAVEALALP